ncbi:MAG: hypothetical protein PHE09_20580 [Oscillospiraceae bacterium]|nr:hypothetical protein [Oscillospiraceae bacterium]
MTDIIQRLKDTYAENHAKALKLLPELFELADEGKIIELPYRLPTKKEIDTVPKYDKEALRKRLKKVEEREAAKAALKKDDSHEAD